MDSGITTRLATRAAAAKYSDFPAPVRREALRFVFNILGGMPGRARH